MPEFGRDLESVRSLHRLLFLMAGLAGVFGLSGLFILTALNWRLLNRLTLPANSAPLPPSAGARASDKPEASLRSFTPGQAEPTPSRLQEILERLDRCLSLLESPPPPKLATDSAPSPDTDVAPRTSLPEVRPVEESARIRLLLGKVQSLLRLGQGEAALACLEEILALDGAHAEALVKKGMVLDQLGRLEEAVRCYDQAIAVDRSMTLAYVYKAGLLNRQQRFTEALDCYEQALRCQSRRRG